MMFGMYIADRYCHTLVGRQKPNCSCPMSTSPGRYHQPSQKQSSQSKTSPKESSRRPRTSPPGPGRPSSPASPRRHSSSSGSLTEGPSSSSTNKMSSSSRRPREKEYLTSSSQSSDRYTSSSSKPTSKSSSSSSSRRHRDSSQDRDDWSEVTNPDERRRIQNRIAQRKFREKAKESRETAHLDSENRRAASYSYSTPQARDFDSYDYDGGAESGLPWGGLSMKSVVQRGSEKYERDSQRGGSSSYGRTYSTSSTAQPIYGVSGPYGTPSYTAGGSGYATSYGSSSGGKPSPGSYSSSYAGSYDDYDFGDQSYSYGSSSRGSRGRGSGSGSR